jgi:CheY-like chemotaxis protein
MSTLFVVDDNEIDQRIIKLNLIKYPVFGFVLCFDRGMPLIDHLNRHKRDKFNIPDTIFLDLNMPEHDGWYVLDALEAMYFELCKRIRVYIVSASVSPKDIARAKRYHFIKGFISKPITGEDLRYISHELNNLKLKCSLKQSV